MQTVFRLFSILAFFTGCTNVSKHKKPTISTETIAALKKQYTPEVFNYFYETVFYADGLKTKLNTITKWNADIKIAILGNPTIEEKDYISFLVRNIQEVEFPHKITFVDHDTQANFKIYIDRKEALKTLFNLSESNNAMCKITSKHGTITAVNIGIANNPDTEYPERKEAIILEEFIQAFGIAGDSFSYPNSIFFEGKNYQEELTHLDREVLKLLYNPKLPSNYSRTQFETDFKTVLHQINSIDKINTYITQKNIESTVLTEIKKYCFINDVFFKHPKTVNVYVQGDAQAEDIAVISKTINALNTLSDHINLKLVKDSFLQPVAGIFLKFKADEHQKYTIVSSIDTEKGAALFPKRIKNTIYINYKKTPQTRAKKEKAIVSSLYKSLGPIQLKSTDNLYTSKNNTITFTFPFDTILTTIYDNTFVDGLTIIEMDTIINHHSKNIQQ